MARNFVRASSQYLSGGTAPITTYPCTLACWFNSNSTTQQQWLIGVDNSASTDGFDLILTSTAHVAAGIASSGRAITSTSLTTGTWMHACGVFANSSSRAAYLNGAGKSSNASTVNPSTPNSVAVGRQNTSAPGNYMNGLVAEAAVWNVALTDAEVLALAQGRLPRSVRPGSLVAYWPIWGLLSPEVDYSSANNLTVTGATASNHAPVTLSTRKNRTPPDIASAGALPAFGWHVPFSQPPPGLTVAMPY